MVVFLEVCTLRQTVSCMWPDPTEVCLCANLIEVCIYFHETDMHRDCVHYNECVYVGRESNQFAISL